MALEDVGQNPPIQLVGNLSQQPVWTCNAIIKINKKSVSFWQQRCYCSTVSACQASLTFDLRRNISLAALKLCVLTCVRVHRALDERLEVDGGWSSVFMTQIVLLQAFSELPLVKGVLPQTGWFSSWGCANWKKQSEAIVFVIYHSCQAGWTL